MTFVRVICSAKRLVTTLPSLADEARSARVDENRTGLAAWRCLSSWRWRAEPLSVHQVPLPGPELIKISTAPAPVGQAGEEAYIRRYW